MDAKTVEMRSPTSEPATESLLFFACAFNLGICMEQCCRGLDESCDRECIEYSIIAARLRLLDGRGRGRAAVMQYE